MPGTPSAPSISRVLVTFLLGATAGPQEYRHEDMGNIGGQWGTQAGYFFFTLNFWARGVLVLVRLRPTVRIAHSQQTSVLLWGKPGTREPLPPGF